MDDRHVKEITDWLMQAGLMGVAEAGLLAGFCERCNRFGLPVERATAVMDTLHPLYERRAFRWDRSQSVQRVVELGLVAPGGTPDNWPRTVFHYLKTTGGNEVRRRLTRGDPADFHLVDATKEDGFTDFITMAHRFGNPTTIGEIDYYFSHFGTARRLVSQGPTRWRCARSSPVLRLRSNAWSSAVSPAPLPGSIWAKMPQARWSSTRLYRITSPPEFRRPLKPAYSTARRSRPEPLDTIVQLVPAAVPA
ncbi:hypothetical protein HJB86_32280 [Rhizobium sp. NZLR3b]|uniref:hypothetical protein n=1 Tax=Rhizobium sp. NZLR3b TaxID=2731101 RepID=UPI001C82EE3C|nr:hypothetical protein [Rhizobium sp. NZLR3b]MBX5193512.1 hypothetical protein [Rhizobium sp. NZLR3b]